MLELTDRQLWLLDGALRLLDRAGIDGVTMRSLATEVNLSPMAAYKHFENQRGLYVALWRTCMDRLRGGILTIAQSGEPDSLLILTRIIRQFLQFAREFPHRFELLFDHPVIQEIGTAWEIESRRSELRDTALGLLVAGQKTGQIRDDLSAQRLLSVVYATVQGACNILVADRLADFTTTTMDEAIETIVQLTDESLRPRK